MLKIGDSIRKFRMAKGLAQKDLAARLQISPAYLSSLENGRKMPSLLLLDRIAEALGVSSDVLIWDSASIPEEASPEERKMLELAKSLLKHYLRTKGVRDGD